jgi:fermentation-respiration switch protein FrsA (DUF1100 family)
MKYYLFFSFVLLMTSCSSVFFQPSKELFHLPDKHGVTYKDVYFTHPNGNKVHSWLLKAKDKKPENLFIFFHGNAQNLSTHFFNLAWMTQHSQDVLILDYSGYGKSDGVPSMEQARLDSLLVLNETLKLKKKYKKLIVYGQSLGGAIAFRALKDFKHKDKIDLLVLDSTFSSYQDLAFNRLQVSWITYLFSPLGYLLVGSSYDPELVVDDVLLPTLVIHGTKDNVVPYKFGKTFFEQLKTKEKWFWRIEGGHHIGTFHESKRSYQPKFLKFLKELK